MSLQVAKLPESFDVDGDGLALTAGLPPLGYVDWDSADIEQ